KKNTFLISYSLVILIGIFFRFYNYTNRWGIASDQARDAIIIQRSIVTQSLPLIGPFSASGPFVFGPSWYIIFIIFSSIAPHFLLTPWIIQSCFFVGIVGIMIAVGTEFENKRLGIITGLLTAVSTAQVNLSTNLIF